MTAATTTIKKKLVIVGIDIGSESTKVVLGPKHGACEIVRNDVGGHTTPTALSSLSDNITSGTNSKPIPRQIGSTAQAKTAITGLTRLLHGEQRNDDEENSSSSSSVLLDSMMFGKFQSIHENEEEIIVMLEDGASGDSPCQFSPSALLAMLLGKIQTNVQSTLNRIKETNENSNVGTDSIATNVYDLELDIVIPPEFSDKAKEQLLDAAYASGASHCRLVESSLAYQYCYQRKFPESTTGEDLKGEKNVLVIDMGKTQTTVTVLGMKTTVTEGEEEEATATTEAETSTSEEKKQEEEEGAAKMEQDKSEETNDTKAKEESTTVTPPQQKKSFQVLSAVRHKSLGAGMIDVRLFKHFQSTLPALSSNASLLSKQSRAGQRLLEGAKKLKHLLSQLPEGTVTVENIGANDSDLKLTCTRKVLAELCQEDAAALETLIQTALEKAGVNVNTNSDESEASSSSWSVEVTGGGCRIPWVKEHILKVANNILGKKLDLSYSFDDTSAALGAGLFGDEKQKQHQEMVDDSMSSLIPETETRKQLRQAEEAMAKSDQDLQARADIMNQMEAHVLELRSAKHDSKHGSLIPAAELDAYLDEVENWIFSEEADNATKDDVQAKWEQVLQKTTQELAKDYLEAKQKEQEAKDAAMEAEAKKAQAEEESAAGGDNNDEDDHDNRRLPKKRRMEIVMKNKAEANELFGDGNFKFAAARYTKALSHCAKFVDLSPDDIEEVNGVKLSLNLNLALAYLKLDNPDQALRVCNEALAIDANSTKALYRRASVYFEKKNWDLANKDVKAAIKIAPDDKAIKKLQQRVEAQIQKQKQKEKKMAQKMFG